MTLVLESALALRPYTLREPGGGTPTDCESRPCCRLPPGLTFRHVRHQPGFVSSPLCLIHRNLLENGPPKGDRSCLPLAHTAVLPDELHPWCRFISC